MGRRAAGRAASAGVIALAASLVVGCTAQDRPSPSAGTPQPGSAVARTTGAEPTTVTSVPDRTRASPAGPSSSRSSSTPRTSTPRTSTRPVPLVPVPRESVALPDGVATEASGLTPAGGSEDVFWTVDDATGTDSLVAVDEQGRQVGSLQVEGMAAGNAEALAAASCTPGSAARCLFIGDIGDHSGRDDVTIHRVPEPASAAGAHTAVDTPWRYTYADGPRNAEAFFVAPDGTIVVIDKPERGAVGSVRAHHVYRGDPGGGVLELVGTFTPPSPTRPLQSMLEGNVVTDAALQVGADRTRVLLQFYDQVLQFTAPRPAADPTQFFRWSQTAFEGPQLIQAEGIAALPDGCGYASISEAGPGGSVARLSVAPCR